MPPSNNIPFTFESREIRVIVKDCSPWFIAKDAAKQTAPAAYAA